MAKVKILQYSSSIDWKELCSLLLSMVYTDDEARGIKISHIDSTEAHGIFYERITYVELVRHPYNGDDEVHHQTYILTEFVISRQYKTLQIYNTTRRASVLITYIASKLGSDFYISERVLNFNRFIDVANSAVSNFKVKKITYPSFNISPTLIANITFSSSDDILLGLQNFQVKLPESPSKIAFDGVYLGRKFSGSVTKSLLFTIMHPDHKELLRALLNCNDKLYV